MKYCIYKVTNKVNGKIYVGAHKTNNINDNYYGSGVVILRAIERYGIKNFKKEILFILDNEDEMYFLEKEVVNENFVNRPDTYNIAIGGRGGWYHIKPKEISKNMKDFWDSLTEERKELICNKISESTKKVMRTPLMKEKIKNGLSNRTEKEKNSQYKNIKKGVKNYYKNETEEEKERRINQKKIKMSSPEVRKRLSESGKNSEKLKGFNNPFSKQKQIFYEKIKEEFISLLESDMFDYNITEFIKNKYKEGFKFYNVLKYYEYKGYIKIKSKEKINDYSVKRKIKKNKTIIERGIKK